MRVNSIRFGRVLVVLCISVSGVFASSTIVSAQSQTKSTASPLQSLQFLVGKWSGAGKSDSGSIRGTSQFQVELDGYVLVRRDSSTFPKQSSNDKASPPYEQLMVISPDPSSVDAFRADYWDSMGHRIEYTGVVSQTNGINQVQFLSIPAPATPQFRLTYTAVAPNRMHTVFEIEPPAATTWHTIADGYEEKAAS